MSKKCPKDGKRCYIRYDGAIIAQCRNKVIVGVWEKSSDIIKSCSIDSNSVNTL